MFRFFHNAVHDVCTRSQACSALLHMVCISSCCAHEHEAKETALRDIHHQTGIVIGGVRDPEKYLPGRSCGIMVCESIKTARRQTQRNRDGSARLPRLPAVAEQNPYNHIPSSLYAYVSHFRTCLGGQDFATTNLTS